MLYAALKVLLTAVLVVAISEAAKRSTLLGGILASLPLTSLLAFIWVYGETGDTAKIANLSVSIFWYVLPSLDSLRGSAAASYARGGLLVEPRHCISTDVCGLCPDDEHPRTLRHDALTP